MSVSDRNRRSLAFFVGGSHRAAPTNIRSTDTRSFPMRIKESEVFEINIASGLIDRRPGDLKPWPGNPRTHNDKQLAQLKSSIQKFVSPPRFWSMKRVLFWA